MLVGTLGRIEGRTLIDAVVFSGRPADSLEFFKDF